jgi:hypothetical protein
MFDWFTKPIYTKSVRFPAPIPYITAPTEREDPPAIYSIGITSESTHMTFKLGHTTLTMNKIGCQQLIDQLEVFKNQLKDEQ